MDHIEGDENDPITHGRLCPRCLALKDYVYNPSRVIYPMKRDKAERGNADAWERCSWDEALDLIMDNWKDLTEKYGRKTMAIFVGTGPTACSPRTSSSPSSARLTWLTRNPAMPATSRA